MDHSQLTASMLQQDVLLWLLVAAVSITLMKWHLSDSSFNLSDLICTDGRLNDKKALRTGTWIVMSYGFYSLVEDGKLTEWYATLYGALWVGNAALDKWQRLKEPKNATTTS